MNLPKLVFPVGTVSSSTVRESIRKGKAIFLRLCFLRLIRQGLIQQIRIIVEVLDVDIVVQARFFQGQMFRVLHMITPLNYSGSVPLLSSSHVLPDSSPQVYAPPCSQVRYKYS